MKNMKTLIFVFVLLFSTALQAQNNSQTTPTRNIQRIQEAHKNVFSLPFEYTYIKDVIMVEVIEARSVVAPNFPSREQTGESQEKINTNFQYWIDNYPKEYDAYLNRVHEITRKYTTTK